MVKKRNGAIDFWRFVFAIVLVIFHTCMLDHDGVYEAQGFLFPFPLGSLAVEFFLLTSGFLFAKSLNKRPENDILSWKGTWSFFKGKLMSFYPAYVICVILTYTVVTVTRLIYVVPPLTGFTDKAADIKTLLGTFVRELYELTLLRNLGVNFERLLDQAWYLSAMLLVMLILYPLYAKNKRRFEYFIAPILAVCLLGFMIMHGDTLLNPSDSYKLMNDYTITFKGNVRVLAEICLGVVCYRVCEWLKKKDFTAFGRIALAIAELFGYVFSILYMSALAAWNYNMNGAWFKITKAVADASGYEGTLEMGWNRSYDYLEYAMLFFLALSVVITFSEKSVISPLFNHRIFSILGQYSLYPYLLYSVYTETLPIWFPEMELNSMMIWYVVLTLITAAVVMILHTLGRNLLRKRKAKRLAAEG